MRTAALTRDILRVSVAVLLFLDLGFHVRRNAKKAGNRAGKDLK